MDQDIFTPSDSLSFLDDSPFENLSHSQFGEDFQEEDNNESNLMSVSILNELRRKSYIMPNLDGEEIEEYLTDPVAQTSVDIIDLWLETLIVFQSCRQWPRITYANKLRP
ncbi:unnamed protein product [Gordionus sp. m RMFG-2023]